jgi:hypothetical protein
VTRPTAVTVISVIGIVLGILGLCGGVWGLLSNSMQGMMGAQNAQNNQQEIFTKVFSDPTYVRYQMFSSLVSLVMSIPLLIGAIGLLGMNSWARGLMIFYAWFNILANILMLILFFGIVMPALSKITAGAPEAKAVMPMLYGFSLCCTPIGLIYPIAALIILNKPGIKSAFESKF